MKKMLSILLTLMLVFSASGAFAADSAHDAETFVNGTEYEYSLKTIGVKPYGLSASECKAATYTSATNKVSMTVFQLPIPELDETQTISNYKFRFCGSSTGNFSTYIKAVKLDGVDFSKLQDLSARLTDEPYASAFNNYDTYKIGTDVTAVQCTNYTDNYYYYLDITDYATECRNNGQTVMYVGVFNAYTKNIFAFTDSGFAADDERIPYTYFTASAMPDMEYLGSNPVDSLEATPVCETNVNSVVFAFNNAVEEATATINGTSTECTIDGANVTVEGFSFGSNTVSVTATDANGTEATASESFFAFAGYEGYDYLKSQSMYVNATEQKISTYNPSCAKAQAVVWRIPLPTLKEGQILESFKLRFLSPNACGESFNLFKLPGQDWVAENLIFTSNETPEGKANIADYANNYNYYKADTGIKNATSTDLAWPDKDNGVLEVTYADLTAYANECILNGQTTMWLGFRSNSTSAITGIGNSTLAPANIVHYIYWNATDAKEYIATPKFVAADDAEETALSSLTSSESYKFTVNYSNYEDADKDVTFIIASYNNKGKLIGVNMNSAKALANTENQKLESEAVTATSGNGKIKAFIWDNSGIKPVLSYASTISVVKPVVDENETPEAPIE